MIVGTAGHIDHGKTTLVRALTGVDTDRLPEEKRRGISLDLGFAFLDAPDGHRIGFIDVPGHERLVHTMLAGATGIDHGLLVVAADDGVMPQTREHLAVLSLLGIDEGLIVITKADRVDAARIAAVRDEVAALVATTPLATAPVFVVAAPGGDGAMEPRGIGEIIAHLAAAAARQHRVDDGRAFRLAVDRAFTLDGVGVVVTGTAHAGRVATGDRLAHLPGGGEVRVRTLHAQNRKVDAATAGQRVAIGLVGIDREALHRGDWLVAPVVALTTARFDAWLRLWPQESKDLKAGTRVQVHLGATVVTASVAPLQSERLAPGDAGLVQLVLQRPIGAWRGDRVVLRDASATRTIAGGQVVDPVAPARYRRTAQRLDELAALRRDTPLSRREALLAVSPLGVDLERFNQAEGQVLAPPAAIDALVHDGWALGRRHYDRAREQVVTSLAAFHQQQPDELGPDSGRLRRLALPRLPDPAWRALLAAFVADGVVSLSGAWVHLPAHGERLSAADQRLAETVAPHLAAAGNEGAWVRDLATAGGVGEPLLRVTLARMARRGDLHQVVRDLYYPRATIAVLGRLCRELALTGAIEGEGGEGRSESPAPTITAARFRDATGLGRKRAIQLLEYFDRIGLLRRHGDEHRLRSDSRLFDDHQSQDPG